MAAPDYKARFADAATLLNYGYSICRLYEDPDPPVLPSMPVEGGVEEQTGLVYDGAFSYLSTDGEDFGTIERILKLGRNLKGSGGSRSEGRNSGISASGRKDRGDSCDNGNGGKAGGLPGLFKKACSGMADRVVKFFTFRYTIFSCHASTAAAGGRSCW